MALFSLFFSQAASVGQNTCARWVVLGLFMPLGGRLALSGGGEI